MHALLIGATGATGQDVLDLALRDAAVERVTIFVRRAGAVPHPKLTVHVVDFDQPAQWAHLVQGDVLFSCLGTTRRAAGSKAGQWKVDYEYQYAFAKAARANHVPCYVLVSSALADPRSRIFYTRMKGQLDEAVKALGFPRLTIFHPPTLIRKNTTRFMERAGVAVLQLLNRLGLLRSQQPLPTEVLAQAMLVAAKRNEQAVQLVSAQQTRSYAQAG